MQRLAQRWRQERCQIGFVPTMGYLHDGHLSLVRAARRRVGATGRVVLSIYVNPTQFGPNEDLAKYPRDLPRDLKLCRGQGVDAVFLPSDTVMYPGRATGDYSTYVTEESLSLGMESETRPTHFRGVTTIVAKLFNCVLPDCAFFGAKDWQQAAVVRRMTRDLNFPIKIVVVPTRREPDGLAMSSRNKYLGAEERPQATILSEAIWACRRAISRGPVSAQSLEKALARLVRTRPAARLDYVAFFDGDTLKPHARVARGTQMALAVFVGKTRLIDNGRL